jgi:hypothetical protein
MQEHHHYRRKQIALITSLNIPSEKIPEGKKAKNKLRRKNHRQADPMRCANNRAGET